MCLIMTFTSGCVGTTPKDIFAEFVLTLKTPRESAQWLQDNITFTKGAFVRTPFQVYTWKIGDCDDMSGFITYISDLHEYRTWEIKIYYSDNFWTHKVGVYWEDKLSYTTNWRYYYGFDTFREIVIDNDKDNRYNWEAYKVYDSKNNIIERGTRY